MYLKKHKLSTESTRVHVSAEKAKAPARMEDFRITVRSARLSAGAGFVVALTGDIMTMPGLGRTPGAERIRVDPDGRVRGLS